MNKDGMYETYVEVNKLSLDQCSLSKINAVILLTFKTVHLSFWHRRFPYFWKFCSQNDNV